MEKTIRKHIRDILITFFFIAVPTVSGFLLPNLKGYETNITIIYILSVLLTARFTGGYFYGIVAAVLSFLTFNWFFTEPYYSLKINDPTLLLTVIIMTITALITSALTSKVKQTAAKAQQKEAESNALYQMTNHLTEAETENQIASIVVQTVSKILSCNAGFLCFDEDGVPMPYFLQQKEDGSQVHRRLDDYAAFQKHIKHIQSLQGSYNIGKEFYDYPIYGKNVMLGILRIPIAYGEICNSQQLKLLHSIMESTSLALDRLYSFREQAKSREETAKERYRGNLLRAISHDLRTPLAGIMGNSEMIMGMTEQSDGRYTLAKDIYEDANWLHSLVENILNLTKFQDGHLNLKKEPEAVEEVIGAALFMLKKRAPEREIEVDIPDSLLLVPMDARLITQVLVNLLDNAVKHTPPNKEIRISVQEDGQMVTFAVMDRGYGIPQNALSKIFQMFYTTSKKESATKKGIGLGLPICQSIVEAHGGSMKAKNRDGGGAQFTFTLPIGDEEV